MLIFLCLRVSFYSVAKYFQIFHSFLIPALKNSNEFKINKYVDNMFHDVNARMGLPVNWIYVGDSLPFSKRCIIRPPELGVV